MSNLLKSLARVAFRRGMGGGNKDWLAFGALLSVLGWIRKRAEAPPEVVHSEVLEPGEAFEIRLFDPPRG